MCAQRTPTHPHTHKYMWAHTHTHTHIRMQKKKNKSTQSNRAKLHEGWLWNWRSFRKPQWKVKSVCSVSFPSRSWLRQLGPPKGVFRRACGGAGLHSRSGEREKYPLPKPTPITPNFPYTVTFTEFGSVCLSRHTFLGLSEHWSSLEPLLFHPPTCLSTPPPSMFESDLIARSF